MSAHSTINITRSKAKQFIVDKVLNGLSDKELESIMDNLLYDHLYNCMIVPDEPTIINEDNDDHLIEYY